MGLLLKYLKLVEANPTGPTTSGGNKKPGNQAQIKPGSEIADPNDPKKEIKTVKSVSSDGKRAVTDDGRTTPVDDNLVVADAEQVKKDNKERIDKAEKAAELAQKATLNASRTYPSKALESQLNRLKVLSGIK